MNYLNKMSKYEIPDGTLYKRVLGHNLIGRISLSRALWQETFLTKKVSFVLYRVSKKFWIHTNFDILFIYFSKLSFNLRLNDRSV